MKLMYIKYYINTERQILSMDIHCIRNIETDGHSRLCLLRWNLRYKFINETKPVQQVSQVVHVNIKFQC